MVESSLEGMKYSENIVKKRWYGYQQISGRNGNTIEYEEDKYESTWKKHWIQRKLIGLKINMLFKILCVIEFLLVKIDRI